MAKLRPNADVDWIDVDGELILRRSSTGDAHLLSATAAILWPFFDGETAIEELADDVADAFGISREQALADITAFADEMQHRRLLTGDADVPVPAGETATTLGPCYLPTPPDP